MFVFYNPALIEVEYERNRKDIKQKMLKHLGKLYYKGIWSFLSRFQTHRFCFVFKDEVIEKKHS